LCPIQIAVSEYKLKTQDIPKSASLEKNQYSCPKLIGSKHFLNEIQAIVEKIKHSKSTILLTGETGVGKTLIAKYLFFHSSGYKAHLRIISLSEIPEDLFEDQLFGHRKGSFTGAFKDFEGKLKATDGGTVILEDVACLPLHLQAKILRVIEEREFERIGETEPVSVDIRIIATTNSPLESLVKEHRFRKDLFFRLNVLPIELLPLRNRLEDIEPLTRHFLRIVNSDQEKNVSQISKDALKALMNYSWPGNVRELRSVIEQAISLSGLNTNVIQPDDLPFKVRYLQHEIDLVPENLSQEMKSLERNKIIEALIRNNGHKGKTALELGISRRTLYYKMEELKIAL
jgi:transcriptional regulator with PAS, ATPase and Fis domain